ncbi:hypothetical protein AHiyo6_11860 [Arthrobacter sp. Hiyo6]|nr:hypothetical protein AHiyo6_11860 [Arthrobacter sp. Hiyo6]
MGQIDFNGNAAPTFDGIFGNLARVRGCSTGNDNDLPDARQDFVSDSKVPQRDRSIRAEPPA